VKHDVGSLHQGFHELAIAYVAVNQSHRSTTKRAPEIFRPASDHVVEGNDLDATLIAEQIDDVGADESCPTSDQNALTLELNQDALLLQDLVVKLCDCRDWLLTASLGRNAPAFLNVETASAARSGSSSG